MDSSVRCAMEKMDLGNKRSSTQAFLDDIAKEETVSKKSLRLELARAKNRKETCAQNIRKTQERIKTQVSKLREHEEAYKASCADIQRLEGILKEGDE